MALWERKRQEELAAARRKAWRRDALWVVAALLVGYILYCLVGAAFPNL